jgi:chromosome segregation ATPase
MGKTSVAVDTLDRLAVQLTGIQEAAQQLREIGSYQDAIADLTRQRAHLLAEVEAAKANYTVCLQDRDSVLAETQREVMTLISEATERLRAAKEQADEILAAAGERAALDLRADQSNREATLKDLQKLVEAERKNLKDTQDNTTQAAHEAKAIEQRVEAAQQALLAIQAQARAMTGL